MSFWAVEFEMKLERHEGSQLLNLKIINYTHFKSSKFAFFIALISVKRSISINFQFEGIAFHIGGHFIKPHKEAYNFPSPRNCAFSNLNFFPVWCVLSNCDGLCIMHFGNSAKYSLQFDSSRLFAPRPAQNRTKSQNKNAAIMLNSSFLHFCSFFLLLSPFSLSLLINPRSRLSIKIFIQMFLDWWPFEMERIREEKRERGKSPFRLWRNDKLSPTSGPKTVWRIERGERDRIPHLDHIASIVWREIWIFLQAYF